MKLLLYTESEDGDSQFRQCYLNEKEIKGWYLPDPEDDGIELINLFFNSHLISVVKNDNLIRFLDKEFNVGFYNKIETK